MVNISKNPLKTKIKRDITEQFVTTVAALDAHSARVFYQQFFSDAEQLLFAKRLAIIFLLREGVSAHRISLLLKVSRDTIYKLAGKYTPVEQEAIITTCVKRGAPCGLLKELKDLLVDGASLDPKRRMKWLNDFEKRYE